MLRLAWTGQCRSQARCRPARGRIGVSQPV